MKCFTSELFSYRFNPPNKVGSLLATLKVYLILSSDELEALRNTDYSTTDSHDEYLNLKYKLR